jgi:ABC-type nitrate/sulfonate/bicarbonate transport system substrate-binding protein
VGVEVDWQDYAGGSGAMAKALREGELDAALLLTEGAIAAIADGTPARIMSRYTDSPLIWGIHVPAASRLRSEADVRGARYAISRTGSGSHLMAFVHAQAQRWPLQQLAFVTVGNLAGAVDAFAAGTADVFFWEKFMTKPLVDSGQFRRVAEFTAPWPAFVVCVADAVSSDARVALERAVALVLDEARSFRERRDAANVVAERYGLIPSDVKEWMATTRWSARVGVTASDVAEACSALASLGVLRRPVSPADCLVAATT